MLSHQKREICLSQEPWAYRQKERNDCEFLYDGGQGSSPTDLDLEVTTQLFCFALRPTRSSKNIFRGPRYVRCRLLTEGSYGPAGALARGLL
jgi:hypothetical protein